jgi:aryl-alcohol dehydrogenase-like predicted oxidoreductase
MRYVRLGQTDLKVSAIAFGTWAFGGDWGAADLHDSDAAISRALELGINLFDTAQGYGFGAAEQLLAEALQGRVRREEVVIATKGGLRMQDGSLLRDASASWLRQGVEASLRNLGTDYLDLYQLHWPDQHTPAAETAGALADLVAEDQILPHAASHDLGVLAYGPLAHGLLGGRMTPATSFPTDDWRSHSPDFTGERFRRNLQVVERLKQFARERAIALPELAVAWTLAHPAVQVAIVGARRPAQLDGTAAAADRDLSADDLRRIDVIVADAVPVWGPHPEGM